MYMISQKNCNHLFATKHMRKAEKIKKITNPRKGTCVCKHLFITYPAVFFKNRIYTENASSNFETQGCNEFQKIDNFYFFPYKWPWRKMGQGQPRVIIWTTLAVLPYMMLHTKFQGHWSIGSGEEDFLRFLPYMGMSAILVMWPGRFE